MPKGKKKDRQGGRHGHGRDSRQPSDEEYDTADNASVISSVSDGASVNGEAEEVDEMAAQENFEDKLKDVIDGLTEKSAKGRTENLLGLRAALSKKYLFDFVWDRKMTIQDGLERCLKKGKAEERAHAAYCMALLCIQLGSCDESEEVFKQVRAVLVTILSDSSASLKARAACATSLGMLTVIANSEISQTMEVMKALENVFRASYFKGDRTAPTHSPEVAALHNAALISWCLLLSISPPNTVENIVKSHLPKLPQLLESQDVDLRITAGESIALLYELAREEDDDFMGTNIDDLCDKLKQLATDGNRHRAKKDRRQQRSSFRDILRAVEEADSPSDHIKFGTEFLYIDSWARKRQYDCLCQVLGSGMNTHLTENELLRDIFGLGAPIPQGLPVYKASKLERTQYNAAAFKARTKARSKNRDKRTVTQMYS